MKLKIKENENTTPTERSEPIFEIRPDYCSNPAEVQDSLRQLKLFIEKLYPSSKVSIE